MSAGSHLTIAVDAEHDAYRALLAGEPATTLLARARDAYLASHGLTGSRSWGRLIGALKMAILAGDGVEPIARSAIAETAAVEASPAGCYARSLAQVCLGDPPDVAPMLAAGDAFERTGRALAALDAGDRRAYRAALAEIVADFERRPAHLAGVPIADTALVLERLAEPRGMAARLSSPLLP